MTLDCSICLDVIENTDIVRILPCKHVFHRVCIRKWVDNSIDNYDCYKCPNCRYLIYVPPTILKKRKEKRRYVVLYYNNIASFLALI